MYNIYEKIGFKDEVMGLLRLLIKYLGISPVLLYFVHFYDHSSDIQILYLTRATSRSCILSTIQRHILINA